MSKIRIVLMRLEMQENLDDEEIHTTGREAEQRREGDSTSEDETNFDI